jgi:hypothetical protein
MSCFAASRTMLVQREMERGRFPLVRIPPLRARIFHFIGVYRYGGLRFGAEHRKVVLALALTTKQVIASHTNQPEKPCTQ